LSRYNVTDVLDIQMCPDTNDAGASSIRGYLKALLERLLIKGNEFSGKRPFGNSGWEYDLYAPMVATGFVTGKLDGNGDVEDVDEAFALKLLLGAVRSL